MKNGKSKYTDIITFIVSVVMISALVASGGIGKLSLAMAAVVFFTGTSTETSTQTVVYEEKTEPATETDVIKSSEITDTPSDIKSLITKYTKLFADDKKDGDIKSVTYEKAGATHIFGNVNNKITRM